MSDRTDEERRRSIDRTNARLDQTIGRVDRLLPYRSRRPLDRVPSIKLKVSMVIGVAIGVAIVTMIITAALSIPLIWGVAVSVVVALVLVQLLSRGLTSPLRDMMDAAHQVANGDYTQRVEVDTDDETGELGRAFNAMTAHIEELERQRRELIANVSHELRTPIAAIRGNIENLLDDVAADRTETLEVMLRQTERLGRLVGQLMDLSRLEAGVTPMRPVEMDLVAVTGDAIQEVRFRAERPDIAFTSPEEVVIVGDPERLHQVVVNLLDNAIEHNEVSEPIQLSIRPETATVALSVEDRGPGIPEEELDRVFERFHTAGADRPPDGTGSGLGLAISKWIVELHGGTIVASNRPGHGCVVEVSLPLSLSPAAQP